MDPTDQDSMNRFLLEQLKRLSKTQEFLALQHKEALQGITTTQEVLLITQRNLTAFELSTKVILGTILAEAAHADPALIGRLTTRMEAHIYTHGDDENVCKAVQKAKDLLNGGTFEQGN